MKTFFSTIFLLIASQVVVAQGTQLLRQPTISDTHVVFVYANDLWKAPITGGDAIRLTTNEGYESAPHFSFNNQWIAFSAQYDGNTDVYVIPATGGEPKRLTWHPSADIVQGWTPDGKVLFRSSRNAHPTQTNTFYTVDAAGNFPQQLGVPRAAYGEVSPSGTHVAYTPITGWDEEWRNYRGGQAMPIWIVNLQTMDLKRTPQNDAERHLQPIWLNEDVYYLSERDYASNIWKYSPSSGEEQQVTFHKKFDVKSLDANANRIIYEQGGYLHLLNPATGEANQLNINVTGDMNYARPRWENVAGNQLRNPSLSPNGKRAAFEHRGEIFTLPKEEGSWRNITNSPGVADRAPAWSATGNKLAWFNDSSGEYQLQIANQMGEIEKTIAVPTKTFYFRPVWSPDGNKLAYTDTDYNILITDVLLGTTKVIDSDLYAHPSREMNPTWSPDSKWVTYVKQLPSHFKAVMIANVNTNETLQVTNGLADSVSPVFDQSGEMIYFLASTDYALSTGWLDMSSYESEPQRNLYASLLHKDVMSPNLLESDEENDEDEKGETEEEGTNDDENQAGKTKKGKKDKSDKEDKDEKKEEEVAPINIDRSGLQQRVVALDLPAGNHIELLGAKAGEVLVRTFAEGSGLLLQKYVVEDAEANEFVQGAGSAVTSSNGEHILFSKGGGWQISSTAAKPNDEGKLNMDVRIKVDPQAEYDQIFKEGWRYMRDFLYVDNVHGAPWDDVYEWYAPWIDDVKHRTDLNYVVDILSGEVAVGHSYVSGGDTPDIETVPVGLLGADFTLNNGFYQLKKIYTGESWNPNVRAPLAEPGLNVKQGDYLLSINGRELNSATSPYKLLEQTANRTITIEVADTPTGVRRELLVKPVSNERNLRTWSWIEDNRRKVDSMSNGTLAYVYVPNTGGQGYQYFNRYYFSQQDKQGVIIDERNNGGGSAADYMIDVLDRELFGYFNSRSKGNKPWTTPMAGIWGPKVMIINERAGSGGDLLPYMFKEAEIGPLVGTRTWGGLVGTWDTPRFIDGGRMVAPRGGFFDADGNWAVEGEGVAPDIEVIQQPSLVNQGQDPQLERAVQEALRLIPSQTIKHKQEPAAPVRWKRPTGFENE